MGCMCSSAMVGPWLQCSSGQSLCPAKLGMHVCGHSGGQVLVWPGYGTQLQHRSGWGFQQGAPTWLQQVREIAPKWRLSALAQLNRLRLQEWYLPVSLSLERVPTVSCLTGRYLKINKLVSFTYGLSAFQTAVFVLGPRASVSVCEPLRVGSLVPTVSWFF